MSKIDISIVYRDRIEQIEKEIKVAIKHKNWSKKSQLEYEKQKLENILSKI